MSLKRSASTSTRKSLSLFGRGISRSKLKRAAKDVELPLSCQAADDSDPYERLLSSALHGDGSLFARELRPPGEWWTDPPPAERGLRLRAGHLGAARGRR